MRPCSRSASRRRWGSWSGQRGRDLLALSVEVGLGVLSELLEHEVDELVGPKRKWNRDRTAVRHGHEDREVRLGRQRGFEPVVPDRGDETLHRREDVVQRPDPPIVVDSEKLEQPRPGSALRDTGCCPARATRPRCGS